MGSQETSATDDAEKPADAGQDAPVSTPVGAKRGINNNSSGERIGSNMGGEEMAFLEEIGKSTVNVTISACENAAISACKHLEILALWQHALGVLGLVLGSNGMIISAREMLAMWHNLSDGSVVTWGLRLHSNGPGQL